jgi:signal transduction histidine kinase
MAEPDTHFARLVSLACHDLRTPLATVHGFARTLTRFELAEPAPRYLGMIDLATGQLTDLLETLALAARIEGRRWEPNLQEVDLRELAASAFVDLDAGDVELAGEAVPVRVDVEATRRALHDLARCALRHGGLQRLEARLSGEELRLGPVAEQVGPILLGDDLRDLGAAVAARVVEALGGSADVDGEALVVRLPAASRRSSARA